MRRCSAGPREIRATSNAPSAAPTVARQFKGEGRPLIAGLEAQCVLGDDRLGRL
jgi:hypothetical protein